MIAVLGSYSTRKTANSRQNETIITEYKQKRYHLAGMQVKWPPLNEPP